MAKEYRTVRQTAEAWKISERLVQKYCAQGRIPGAQKFGVSWEIPADAEKPGDPRRQPAAKPAAPVVAAAPAVPAASKLMPLLNTPFPPGQCMACIEKMEDGPRKDIALAEYHYFSGQAEQAAQEVELYLADRDLEIRLSACLIYAYANLTIGQIQRASYTLAELQRIPARVGGKTSPQLVAAKAFAASTASVLLHLPLPTDLPPGDQCWPLLPPGLRAFAMYVQAHYTYLQGEYAQSLGLVEATLTMQTEVYPIPTIYLHLVAVMDNMSLRRPEQAQRHLLAAWELARPDDLIEGFGEHHGLLGGMLEAVIKKDWPEDFKRIIAITYRFSAGWRRIHNPVTGHDVADNLTTTEFAVAMLAARGWTNQEIAEHLHISANTVKSHLSEVMRKLNVETRKELKQYMLR